MHGGLIRNDEVGSISIYNCNFFDNMTRASDRAIQGGIIENRGNGYIHKAEFKNTVNPNTIEV